MAIAELVMPKLGESIMEATILKWHKKVGDFVKHDETVLDIATDKVDSEVPSTEEGILVEILFQVNDVVPIGTVIARIQTSKEASQSSLPENPPVAIPAPVQEAPVYQPIQPPAASTPTYAEPPTYTATPTYNAPASDLSDRIELPINVPYTPSGYELPEKAIGNRFYSPLVLNIANSEGISLSELERIPGTGNDGRVSKKDVLQYVADRKSGKIPPYAPNTVYQTVYQQVEVPVPVQVIAPAQPITAPITEAEAPTQQFIEPVAQVPQPVFQAPVEAAPTTTAFSTYIPDEPVAVQPTETVAQVSTAPQAPAASAIYAEPAPTTHVAPVAAPLTQTESLIYSSFPPQAYSGKFSDPSSVTVTGNTEIIEMDRMRKLIAKHMVDSKHTSPHVTSFTEADVTNMVEWRERVKVEFEKREGTKLTYTPMFMECIAEVIKKFPLVNCSIEGDKIIIRKDINIGMATALPSGNLIVPVIKGADQLNIVGLSKAVNGLADAARNSRLKPDDTTGATFTLTNVGTFGSLMGTPIIPQPQVAILAVGAIKKRPMVIESANGDTIGIRHMMYLSMSYDHRIVDGSIGASFLTAVGKAFENWDPNKQWFAYL